MRTWAAVLGGRGERGGGLVRDTHLGVVARGGGDGIADNGGEEAVVERGSERSDVAVVDDRIKQVGQFVDERVLPPDDVAGRPPVLHERVRAVGDQNAGKTARSF